MLHKEMLNYWCCWVFLNSYLQKFMESLPHNTTREMRPLLCVLNGDGDTSECENFAILIKTRINNGAFVGIESVEGRGNDISKIKTLFNENVNGKRSSFS